jgi:predicted ATPase
MPLYPKAAQEKGRWVILKGDSGPGRMNTELLAELQASGFILFLGVPNTTTVFQETDQNYGPFKHQYATNLGL